MLLRIDHLVIAVRDPDAAAAELERDAGLAFAGGGRHAAMGTFNRLAFLGDTYLELIGVFDRRLVEASVTFAVGRASMAVLDGGREGLATWALATDDVAGDAMRLRAGGSSIGEPVGGSRTRPDGGVVHWITAFPALGPTEPPFLIQHEHEGPEWGDEARAARAAFSHPAGGRVRVTALELPMADPAAAADAYGRVLGIAFSEGWRTAVGEQAVVLRADTPGTAPVVHLLGDPRTPPLDLVRFGIRWVRTPAEPAEPPPPAAACAPPYPGNHALASHVRMVQPNGTIGARGGLGAPGYEMVVPLARNAHAWPVLPDTLPSVDEQRPRLHP